jgi:hypothetical protein
MPHSTRLSTPIPRSYLSDPWLNEIDDPLAREFFLRAKLACDNCGRLPGDAGMLAGILFPGVPLNRKRTEKILEVLVKGRLIFHYQVGRQWFLEICDTGATQRLVGHMTDQSEYPPPPAAMVEKWEAFTGRKREVPQRVRGNSKASAKKNANSNGVDTGSDEVHTGSNAYEQVSTCIAEQSRAEQSRVGSEKSREESDFAKTANATYRAPAAGAKAADKTYGQLISDPATETSLEILTAGKFLADVGFRGYRDKGEFLTVVKSCFDARRDVPMGGRQQAIDFMEHVANSCNGQDFDAPKGWLRVLGELRAEQKQV